MRTKTILKSIGPGLIWAAAAVGVSHLVQSTRAGANFGFELIWVIVIINILKYPFFEFAPRYSAATGKTLLQGYNDLGRWAVYLYLFVTVSTMFALQAAVTIVTAGLFAYIFPGVLNIVGWSALLLLIISVLVIVGKYAVLDKIIKVIIIILSISTIIAVFFSLSNGFDPNPNMIKHFDWGLKDVAFVIAFAGWMPTAIDVSVWHSFWTIARKKETGYAPKVKEALFDFNIGYIGTLILAVGFLSLGALVMYGSGVTFSSSGAEFSGQLINLYTTSIGSWAYYLIAVAAIATMFSTTLTCLDAYPRVLRSATEMIIPKVSSNREFSVTSYFWLILVAIGAFIIIRFFATDMKLMVDVVTTLSFLTAPILGWLNYKVVFSDDMPSEGRPKRWLKVLSWFGLIGLTSIGVAYVIYAIIIKT